MKRSLPMASILDAGIELKTEEFSHVSKRVTVERQMHTERQTLGGLEEFLRSE